MGNQNRKASKAEMAHARRVIEEAAPGCQPVFGGHSAYGGHRAPRDHTLSFRLRDARGQVCSNVIWLMPDELVGLTVDGVRARLARASGKRRR